MQIVNIKVIWCYGRFEQYDDSTGTHWRINGSGARNQNRVLMLIIINIENINNVEIMRGVWHQFLTSSVIFTIVTKTLLNFARSPHASWGGGDMILLLQPA